MIDYQSRTYDFSRFAHTHYGIDTAHAKMIAAVLMRPAKGTDSVWLIVDSVRHPFWEHLSGAMIKLGISRLRDVGTYRLMRPSVLNPIINELMEYRDLPLVMLDSHWKAPLDNLVHGRSQWPEFAAQFIRMRIELPALRLPPVGAAEELYHLLSLALNTEHRQISAVPVRATAVDEFQMQLLSILNPELSDLHVLANSLQLLPALHAVLHGRDQLEEIDRHVRLHAMRSTVRKWTADMLELFARGGYYSILDLQCASLSANRQQVMRECKRLVDSGVLEMGKGDSKVGFATGGRRRWMKITDRYRMDVEALMMQ